MIKNILIYTIIPCLITALVILIWANNRIRVIKNSYDTKLEIPLDDLKALHNTITTLYQSSLGLNNPENKESFLSQSIELYKLNSKLVQNYLKLVKEDRTFKTINNFRFTIERDAQNAEELMNKIKSLRKRK